MLAPFRFPRFQPPVVHLTDADIEKALTWDKLIPAMEDALANLSAGKVVQPLREWITIEEDKRFWGVMPAASEACMGIKLVSLYPHNAEKKIPTVMAVVLLVRPDTGEPVAIVDANGLTARRTAAVSAAITKRLAPEDSRVLAILGSGQEAQSHFGALTHIIEFEEVRIWSRTPEHANAFAKKNGAKVMDAESAVRGADVIVCATGTQTAILKGAWLKHGAHVNSIGAPMPTWRELDDEAMHNRVVVESREAAQKESGDIILSGAQIAAEVGEIFAGTISVPRTETTIYKSVGVAIEDIATAKLVLDSFLKR